MNIEEIAFKDRKTLANLNGNDLLDIIEFLQNDRKQWINQFSRTHNESIDIQKENKELKEKLDKYENPEDMTLMMMWCTEKVKDENQALKKQLEDYKKLGFKYLQDKNNNLENQQKEFIKYMNSCIKELEKESPNKLQNTINLAIKDIAKIILQKYKEIIGVSDEKEN